MSPIKLIVINWRTFICPGNHGPFEYISVTPPYTQVDYGILMDQISKSALVGEDSFIVSVPLHGMVWYSSSCISSIKISKFFDIFIMQVVEYPLKTDMLSTCGCLVKVPLFV